MIKFKGIDDLFASGRKPERLKGAAVGDYLNECAIASKGWPVDLSAEVISGPALDTWERPVPFEKFNVPVFPVEVFPAALRNFVRDESTATQTPIDLPALLILATLAVSCAKKFKVRVNDGYEEPVNLFVVATEVSAGRKSSTVQHVTAPLRSYEYREMRRMAPQMAEYDRTKNVLEKRLARLQEEAAAFSDGEDQHALQEANNVVRQLEALIKPKSPILIAQDVTAEKLTMMLEEHEGRMAVISAEGGPFDLMKGRYSKDPNFDVYLKGHAGDDIHVDRVGRPRVFVASPALTLGLAVQPDVIADLGKIRQLRGRGLLARFLYGLPASKVGTRVINPAPVPASVRDAYHRCVTSLLEIQPQRNDAREIVPYYLTLDSAAEQERISFATWLEPMLGETGELAAISDWAGKLSGAVLRIAALLHLAEHVDNATLRISPISGETLWRAVRIAHYLIPHARAAFGLMGADPVIRKAKVVLDWTKKTGAQSFSGRDAFLGNRSEFVTVKNLRPILDLLCEHSHIRPNASKVRHGAGRPPSPLYDVNPLLFQEDADVTTPLMGSADIVNFRGTPPASGSVNDTFTPAAEDEFEEGSL